MTALNLDDFITRWQNSAAAERANYALFLTQLCDLLEVPQPEPTRASVADNAYVFERDVTFDLGDGTATRFGHEWHLTILDYYRYFIFGFTNYR